MSSSATASTSTSTAANNNNSATASTVDTVRDCPVFRPTAQEFEDPMAYINSIRVEAEQFGICKIIPPRDVWPIGGGNEAWLREVNASAYAFPSKLQPIYKLMRRDSCVAVFLAQLAMFEASHGRVWTPPNIAGRAAPLYALYCAVTRRGGFAAIENDAAAWHDVLLECKCEPSVVNARRATSVYQQCLLEYERNCNARSPLTSDADIAAAIAADEPLRTRLRDFSYGDGGDWTLASYRRMADAYLRDHFGVAAATAADASDDRQSDNGVDVATVEREYWRIVETGDDGIEVAYGNDLSSVNAPTLGTHASGATHHSLFPTGARNDLSFCGWNLNRFARARGSLLRYMRQTVPGITDPMVYVGMVFSTFCWHTEDNYLASINYLHGGAPKVWYGVGSAHRDRFEALMRMQHAELFAAQPDLLYQLVTTISPRLLRQHGVPFARAVQRPGEFVITFPASYHAGFNCGFNVAEAVNFGTEHWLPFGRRSLDDYHRRVGNRPSAFSYHNLLCMAGRAALAGDMTRELARAVADELRAVRQDMIDTRDVLAAAGVTQSDQFPLYGGSSTNAEVDLIQCFDCQVDCFLLAVVCPCSAARISCTKHFDRLCACANSSKRQLVRYSERKLQKLIDAVEERLATLPTRAEAGAPSRAQIKADALAIDKWREEQERKSGGVSMDSFGPPSKMAGSKRRR